jgi:uncharacterized protein (TIGR00251 family)
MKVRLETTMDGIRLSVKVVPGSSRTALAGVLDGMLKIKVASPAEKGKANQCLTAYLSRLFGVRKNQIQILSGTTSPVKHLQIAGISMECVRNALEKVDE